MAVGAMALLSSAVTVARQRTTPVGSSRAIFSRAAQDSEDKYWDLDLDRMECVILKLCDQFGDVADGGGNMPYFTDIIKSK